MVEHDEDVKMENFLKQYEPQAPLSKTDEKEKILAALDKTSSKNKILPWAIAASFLLVGFWLATPLKNWQKETPLSTQVVQEEDVALEEGWDEAEFDHVGSEYVLLAQAVSE